MSLAIQVVDLCKQYRVCSGNSTSYHTVRESLTEAARATRRAVFALARHAPGARDRLARRVEETFSALDGVSFDVRPGDVVGVIGRNGAGKSTLLKILSRITEPTRGSVVLRGRIASLLEVGTGFHPELTGRENVYMNGSILGMSRREITRRFEEIVDFAGVERFLDTPVKRYSSGMYVRLAFAVAAHLNPEILVIDEVLAVGDAEFQRKCLGKMQDVARAGRTILFVSHNMAAVRKLCTRGVVLQAGRAVFIGDVEGAVGFYAGLDQPPAGGGRSWAFDEAPGSDAVRLLQVAVEPASGDELNTDSGLLVRWAFQTSLEGANLGTTLQIRNAYDVLLIHEGIRITTRRDSRCTVYEAEMRFPPLLNAGRYHIGFMFGENQKYLLAQADNVLSFDISYRASNDRYNPTPGALRPQFESSVRDIGALGHV
jgi:lipopolysaccharide transport system ATP-binding protein